MFENVIFIVIFFLSCSCTFEINVESYELQAKIERETSKYLQNNFLIEKITIVNCKLLFDTIGENQVFLQSKEFPLTLINNENFIICCKSEDIFKANLTNFINQSTYTFIFSDTIRSTKLKDIFTYLWNLDITNVTIINYNKEGFLQIFNTTELRNQLDRKEFIIGCTEICKYSPLVSGTEKNDVLGNYALAIERALNLRVKVNLHSNVPFRTLLQNTTTDAAMTIVRLVHYYKTFEASSIIFFDQYYWAIAKPSHIPSFQILIKIFSFDVWMAVILCYIVTVFVWMGFKKITLKSSTLYGFFEVFEIILGKSLNKIPPSLQLRIILFFTLIYSIYILNFFQAKLQSLMIDPPLEETIDSMEDLLLSKITPVIPREIVPSFSQSVMPLTPKLIKKMEVKDWEQNSLTNICKYLSVRPNETTMLPNCIIYQYKNDCDKIRKFDSYGLPSLEAIFHLRKGHPLLKMLNRVILMVQESGLVWKWFNDMQRVEFEAEEKMFLFDLGHFGSAFAVLGFGCITAFIFFVLEVVYFKLKCSCFRIKA